MNNKTLVITALMVACLILMLPDMLSAQPSFPDDPDQIPIDGGLVLLFAAGSGYALRKLNVKKKRQACSQETPYE